MGRDRGPHGRHPPPGGRRPLLSRGAGRAGRAREVGRVKPGAIVVLGAGPTGLPAALTLGAEATLVEREERVGGCCRSVVAGGFTFDHAGHIMFSNDPYVHDLYRILLGDNVHWQEREAWIYSKGVHTRYPFQGALYGLPPQVIQECVVGAIEARFGPLKPPSPDSLRPLDADAEPRGATGNGHAASNGH